MTKVEELRELRDALDDLIETEATKILTAHQFLELPGFDKIMDAIVAAARSEGVAEGFAEGVEDTTADLALVQDAETFARGKAEGAEQERERICGEAELITRGKPLDDADVEMRYGERDWVVATHDLYVIPASVLAPTKEKS